jgi:hypothetical protein
MKLVLIHGRAQEHKDSIALKAEWIAALGKGLEKSRLELPIPEPDVRFPFYGDALFDLVAGKSKEEAAQIIVRGTQAKTPEAEFTKAYLEEVLAKQRITQQQIAAISGQEVIQRGPLNWEWVQSGLKAIDRFVPFGSSTSVALATKDVYRYLKDKDLRDLIDEGVCNAMEPDVPTVVVGHSLGTIVSYNVLRMYGSERGWNVPFYITVGSPLGVTVVKDALQEIAPIRHPECVSGNWFNAMDERDVVALYPLDKNNFPMDPAIENKTNVLNHTQNRHGIAGYLDDQEVAKRIYDALVAT